MADDGNGVFSLPSAPFVSGTTADPTAVNNNFSQIATALTDRVTRSGTGSMSGNLAMGSNRITGLASGTARADAASVAQLQDAGPLWAGTTGGTSTAYTASLTPAIAAYAAGLRFFVDIHTACGAAPTINLNGVGAKNIKLASGGAPGAGAIHAGPHLGFYDGTNVYLSPLGVGGPATVYAGTLSAATSADILLPSGFAFFKVHGYLRVGTDQVNLLWRTSTDGGSNFDTGASDYSYIATVGAGSSVTTSSATSTAVFISSTLDNGATSNALLDGTVYPGDGAIYPRVQVATSGAGDAGAGAFQGQGWFTGVRVSATRINAMRILPTSGTITGRVVVLGYV
jgi:hypothetical protein